MSQRASFETVLLSLRAELGSLRERVLTLELENQLLREESKARDAADAALQTENAALREQLLTVRPTQKNASNSSKPPSSDHPHDPKSQRDAKPNKPGSGRKRGGQPGHPGASRTLVPQSDVDHLVTCVPSDCAYCQAELPARPTAGDPSPIREQVCELPPIDLEITEFELHCRTCAKCGKRTWGLRPPDAPKGCLGFRAQGAVGLLTGGAQLTRRPALTLLRELTGLPLSLGKLSTVEAILTRALGDAYAEVAAAVVAAPVVNCDETPWRSPDEKPWLWTAATPEATLFRISSHRDTAAFLALGLDRPGQIKVTDRYTVYTCQIPMSEHAICWSHLTRDFISWVGHDSVAGGIARWLSDETGRMFQHWHAFQAGEIDRAGLAERLKPVQSAVRTALKWGAASGVSKFKGLCQNLLARWETLWTFVKKEGVEPTNNRAERAIRPGVLWRKVSLFTQSERGRGYVERMLTVKTTLRQRGGNLLEFLAETLRAAQIGEPPPKLLGAPAL